MSCTYIALNLAKNFNILVFVPVWIVFSVVGATSKEALSYQIILFDVIGWQSQVVKILNILVYVVSLVDSS